MGRLAAEKVRLEGCLRDEVRERQELVIALGREKQLLSGELEGLVREVRRAKHKIKKHTTIAASAGAAVATSLGS
jgi:hypothetical protein